MHLRHLPRIAARLYTEPWLITGLKHDALRAQFRAALSQRIRPRVDDDDDPDCDDFTPQMQQQADMSSLDRLEIEQGIAIVPICGILGKHLSMIEMMCGGYDLDVLNAQCLALMNRADVHTIVFAFNTPGGAAAGVADSAAMIRMLAEQGQKKTVAYCDEACSGGMWLAAACDQIICGQSAMIGSISALCAILDESKAFEMEGLKMQVFTDGALKGAGIDGTSLTEAQRADIQGRVEHIGTMFKSFIATRRPTVKTEDMQGQWFYGDQAKEKGLVDELIPTLPLCIASLMQ